MSYSFLGELPKRVIKTESASRFFAYQTTSNDVSLLGKIFDDGNLPRLQSEFPGISTLFCDGYSMTTPRENELTYLQVEVFYQRNKDHRLEKPEERPWDRPWAASVSSVIIPVQTYMRFDPFTKKLLPHLNTAGDCFEKPISTVAVNDLICLKKDFITLSSQMLFDVRGSINDGPVSICNRSGEMGQFLMRNIVITRKMYHDKKFNEPAIPYYSLELEIEFCDQVVQGAEGEKKGFYFALPSVGSREIKTTVDGKVLTPICIPRRGKNGAPVINESGEEILDYVENWNLTKTGQAVSQSVTGTNEVYVMGPFLAQRPKSWDFVTRLKIPQSL